LIYLNELPRHRNCGIVINATMALIQAEVRATAVSLHCALPAKQIDRPVACRK
jgi:hypothetical protein